MIPMGEPANFVTGLVSTFSVIGLAEFGDKSQLVCMSLAMRYRALPVFFGALTAFSLLNLMAITVGKVALLWLPATWVLIGVGLLFLGFGLHSFYVTEENNDDLVKSKTSHGVFISTVLLLTVAEFGDKTQLAVAGLATSLDIYSVWFGATLALATTSAIGIWAGRQLLQSMSMKIVHQISGLLFFVLGIAAFIKAFI